MNLNDIQERIKIDFEFITGFKYQGMIKSLGLAFASRVYEFKNKLDWVKQQAFISTAEEEYLYLHAGKRLPILPGEKAEGLVIFYGIAGVNIESGTEIKVGQNKYITLEEGTITPKTFSGVIVVNDNLATLVAPDHSITSCSALVNNTVTKISTPNANTIQFYAETFADGSTVTIRVNKTSPIKVISEKIGEAYNLPFNSKVELIITRNSVDTDVGVILITGGKEPEDIEEYRNRVLQFISSPEAPFSKPNIIGSIIRNIKTIKNVWVKGGEYEEGQVSIFAINYNNTLTTTEREDIFNIIRAILPAQLPEGNINIGAPTIVDVELYINEVAPISEQLNIEIQKNITAYFDKLSLFEKAIDETTLRNIVYATSYNDIRPLSFNVSGVTSAQESTLYKISNVEVTSV